jgi:hypothetical protein
MYLQRWTSVQQGAHAANAQQINPSSSELKRTKLRISKQQITFLDRIKKPNYSRRKTANPKPPGSINIS